MDWGGLVGVLKLDTDSIESGTPTQAIAHDAGLQPWPMNAVAMVEGKVEK